MRSSLSIFQGVGTLSLDQPAEPPQYVVFLLTDDEQLLQLPRHPFRAGFRGETLEAALQRLIQDHPEAIPGHAIARERQASPRFATLARRSGWKAAAWICCWRINMGYPPWWRRNWPATRKPGEPSSARISTTPPISLSIGTPILSGSGPTPTGGPRARTPTKCSEPGLVRLTTTRFLLGIDANAN